MTVLVFSHFRHLCKPFADDRYMQPYGHERPTSCSSITTTTEIILAPSSRSQLNITMSRTHVHAAEWIRAWALAELGVQTSCY